MAQNLTQPSPSVDEIDLKEMLGETDLPTYVEPYKDILL